MIKVIRNVGKRFICYRYVWSLYANIKLIVNKRYIIQIHPIKEKNHRKCPLELPAILTVFYPLIYLFHNRV